MGRCSFFLKLKAGKFVREMAFIQREILIFVIESIDPGLHALV